uniref:Guanosine nucleotide diphosphate dissociation inhibitor n=1 Tax=Manihot esculenta TaxID=3983 RepID=A0A2C9VJZ2_MANES
MDKEYDMIVLGTGLKECILSGLLSVDGLKVLRMDKNDYYGGESTSLNLNQLWKRSRGSDGKPPESLGMSKEYNVDMIPKKFRARNFFTYIQDYEENDPKSHNDRDLTKVTAREIISENGLKNDRIDFIGHALALDSYLDQPALDFVKRMKLYAESLARFQGGSPYIYPMYGLGELPQAFARVSAVYGGTYMLNKPECKVEFDGDGKAISVTSEGETAKCKKIVCDPSYLPDKVKKVGKVARAICIMSHPIPNNSDSHLAQLILPQKQLGRKSDMRKYMAFVSTEAETDNPEVELKPGIHLLVPVDEIFYYTYDRYVPTNHYEVDHCFISTVSRYNILIYSFENTVDEVIEMYSKIIGKLINGGG